MMRSLGHTVYHYGAEGSEVNCDEHVDIISREEQEKFFGKWDMQALYVVDWTEKAPYWKLTNDRAAAAINARKQSGDFVCVICGPLNKPLTDAVSDTFAVEYGIGYNGTYAQYRVFESYSHMHRIWGQLSPYQDMDGRFYDAVIPNYFNPDDTPYKAEKSDFFLYVGRLIKRKGISIAVETCKQLGAKLVIAGQGCKEYTKNRLVCMDGGIYEGDIDYVGCVVGKQKAELFQSAKAVFVPTIYVEPFGGTAVEAQLAGTPAITTDWGAMTETVEHGKTGFRCHTLDQFVWAAKHVGEIDTWYTHQRAVANYSMDRVRYKYDEYFKMLSDLRKTGWYEIHEERKDLNWLRQYP
jgi:glycosyltransferase involved in cell wall biosynthesis